MTVDELIDNLGWQVNPDVEDTVFLLVLLESVLQILFNSLNKLFSSLKVMNIPLVICLTFILVTDGSIRKQMVEKLYWKHVDTL